MAGYRYLVDANTLSDFIRNPTGSVTKRLAVVGVATVCTSIIVACELRYGVAKKGSARLAERVDQTLEGLEVLPLDGGADRHYAEIRAHHAVGTDEQVEGPLGFHRGYGATARPRCP